MGFNDSLARLEDSTTFFDGKFDQKNVIITVACSIALYNASELLLLIFTTFRHFRGAYFWFVLVATVGLIPFQLCIMLDYFQIAPEVVNEILGVIGWPLMVTGQSLVLYSRLGVVLGPEHRVILACAKWMIIVDAFVLHTTTSVTFLGTYNAEPNTQWSNAYNCIEKIQMTVFTLQEFILSGLYIWRTTEILKTSRQGRKPRRVLMELAAINVIIILMDVALLFVEYENRHVVEEAIKGAVYSVKLKLEFATLSKLVEITRADTGCIGDSGGRDSDRALCDNCKESLSESTIPLGPLLTVSKEDEEAKIQRPPCTVLCPRSESMLLHHEVTAISLSYPSMTFEERLKRRMLDENLYAGACRDLSR